MAKSPKTRLRALVGLNYPVGRSLTLVRKRGLKNFSAEEVAKLDIKRVEPGGYCDDAPKEMISSWLTNGKIERVGEPKKKRGG